MGFHSFWDGFKGFFKGVFSGTGKIAECFTSWNTNYHLLFGSNRFPMLTKNWWKHSGKWDAIKGWWNGIGCIQSILYVMISMYVFSAVAVLLFFGSDVLLDFEDVGLLFEGFFTTAYEMFQIGLEWTVVFFSFFLLTMNPIYHLINSLCVTLDISALPMYIITFLGSAIFFLIIYKFVYKKYINGAGKKHPAVAKFFNVLDWPLHFIVDTFGDLFGNYARGFFDVLFFPIRVLLVFVDILLEQLKF